MASYALQMPPCLAHAKMPGQNVTGITSILPKVKLLGVTLTQDLSFEPNTQDICTELMQDYHWSLNWTICWGSNPGPYWCLHSFHPQPSWILLRCLAFFPNQGKILQYQYWASSAHSTQRDSRLLIHWIYCCPGTMWTWVSVSEKRNQVHNFWPLLPKTPKAQSNIAT